MIEYTPIGLIHSPYKEPAGTPIQAVTATDIEAIVEIYPDYVMGLKDIEGFSHLILLYHLHRVRPSGLLVKPFLGNELHGIFATRSPGRPNPIGFSIVRLIKVDGHILWIRDVDILDQTPVLDIKPYVAEFDVRQVEKNGWFAQNLHKLATTTDDGRFAR
ncbi:MAG: tRNA (N6-threonylcarbamoyladenosine(37)-N6)-methyltransferase TrmO [Negativicutes bacterium]